MRRRSGGRTTHGLAEHRPGRPRRRATRNVAAFLAAGLLACGGGEDARSPGNPSTGSGRQSPGPGADTAARSADASDEGADSRTPFRTTPVQVDRAPAPTPVLDTVRIARHEDYDRIVFEFGDEPLPGYRVTLGTGPATQCGSGHEVALDGEARIEIDMNPARAHTDEGRSTIGAIAAPAELTVVRELVRICDFEAHLGFAAGLDAPAAYRVIELDSPTRIVLDIRRAAT